MFLVDSIPQTGNKIRGKREVTAKGIHSLIHQIAIQIRIPEIGARLESINELVKKYPV